jgi:hypothetical protein
MRKKPFFYNLIKIHINPDEKNYFFTTGSKSIKTQKKKKTCSGD